MPNEASNPVQLASTLDLLAAGPLCEQLRERLNSDASFELDASEVERVSTACLQLLVAASLAARTRGGAVRFSKPSPALSQALADLGLDQSLFS